MNETFIRTAQLLGDQGFSRLSSSVVAVFGLGGVGSHCAEALARSGVGTLFLIDSDTVAPSNINRQSIALLSTVGQNGRDEGKDRRHKSRVLCFHKQRFCAPGKPPGGLFLLPCEAGLHHRRHRHRQRQAGPGLLCQGRGDPHPVVHGHRKQAPSGGLPHRGYLLHQRLPPVPGHAQGIKKAGDPRLKGPVFRGDAPQTRNAGRDEGLRPSRSCQHRFCAAGGRAPHSRRDPELSAHWDTLLPSRDRPWGLLSFFLQSETLHSPHRMQLSFHVQYTPHYSS